MARIVVRATDPNGLESAYYVISDIPQVRQAAIDSLRARPHDDVCRVCIYKIVDRPPYYVIIEDRIFPDDRSLEDEVIKYE